LSTLNFAGPDGSYQIIMPDKPSLEDHSFAVVANGKTSHWHVEVDERDAGIRKLAGMTRDGSGLWFELKLGPIPEVQYWGNQRLVRTDKAV
jgi:hypothetical protein